VPRGQGVSILHAPGCQSSFIPYRIILDPVDRLPGEPCGHGDLANALVFEVALHVTTLGRVALPIAT
jgi:hypothetical protein